MSGACDNFILEDQSCEWFELVQYVESFDMGINFLEGPPGPPGPAGEAIFIPSVSEDGVLSWTNTAGMPNPDPVDLSGPAGTTDYLDLTNKPSINGVPLSGNKSTAELNISFSANEIGALDLFTGIQISQGDDLNDYITPGVYYSPSASVSSTLTNAPSTSAFKLVVMQIGASYRLYQLAFINSTAATILKRYYNGTWSAWVEVLDENDLPTLPISLENGGTGTSATTAIDAINALGGRTFYYENIAGTNTVTISSSGLAEVALFFGGPSAARVGAYIVYFPNATSSPFVVPMVDASAITITPSTGTVTISAGVQLYMAVMCLYEATAGRLTITKT